MYFKDPDVKPQTSLTAQQLIRFAWQIADGMSYLSSKKVCLKLGTETVTTPVVGFKLYEVQINKCVLHIEYIFKDGFQRMSEMKRKKKERT